MAHEYRHLRTVAFAETDMAGIVHFSRYFLYMEEAEHAFLRSLGLRVHAEADGSVVGFPRISVRCEYVRPLRFEEVVETHIWVRRKGTRSLTYQLTISSCGKVAARGEVTTICVRFRPGEPMEATPIPPEFAARIEEAPYPPIAWGERAL